MSWEKFKRLDKGIVPLMFPEYKINKWIFRVALLLIFVIGFFILKSENFDFSQKVYVSCPVDSRGDCENPFYYEKYVEAGLDLELCPDSELCRIKEFAPGSSYGTPPNNKVEYFEWSIFVIFLIALLLNHFLYNKGFKFKTDFEEEELK